MNSFVKNNDLFVNCSWGSCFNYIRNIVYRNNNAFLISAPKGSGKTVLQQKLSSAFPNDMKVFTVSAQYQLGVASFMKTLTLGFGVPISTCNNESKPLFNWDLLQNHIVSQPEYSWLLIVDDTEKLSWDLLNTLTDLYKQVSAQGSNFSLILLADPSFMSNINGSTLKKFIVDKTELIELLPLTLQQTKEFLLNYLKLDLSITSIKQIYKASNGIIGKVKRLSVTGIKQKNFGEVMKLKNLLQNIASSTVIRVSICVGLLLTAYLVFLITQKKDVNQLNVAIEPATIASTPVISSNVPSAAKDLQSSNLDFADFKELKEYEQIYQKLHTDLKQSLEQDIAKLQQDINTIQNRIKSLSIVANNPESSSPNVKSNKTIVKQKTLVTNVEKQLLHTDQHRYALQLMASKNETTAKKLVSKHPDLMNKIKYFSGKFVPSDDTWFIVIHGIYNTPKDAKQDVHNLPLDIQQLQPIVRNYKSVHQIINNKKSSQ